MKPKIKKRKKMRYGEEGLGIEEEEKKKYRVRSRSNWSR